MPHSRGGAVHPCLLTCPIPSNYLHSFTNLDKWPIGTNQKEPPERYPYRHPVFFHYSHPFVIYFPFCCKISNTSTAEKYYNHYVVSILSTRGEEGGFILTLMYRNMIQLTLESQEIFTKTRCNKLLSKTIGIGCQRLQPHQSVR